ncbi:MAG: YdcF family protein [Candidatus Contendobacter sp.]|nr:YdcF family protein [Candidatus Contendobacter sp.]
MLRWRPRLGQRLIIVGSLLSYGFSIPFTAGLLNRPLQSDLPPTAHVLKSQQPGAIVVLGGGLHTDAPEYDEGPTVHERTLGRIRYAARLARLTGLPVLAAGGRPKADEDPDKNPSEAELMKGILEEEFRIPQVLTETTSRDTWENAVNSAALLRERQINTILLVTNAAHLPRAAAAFQAQGLTVIPAPTLFFNVRPDLLDLRTWLPSVTAIAEIHYAGYEWLGKLWYAWRYH